MTRKDFFAKVGFGAALVLAPCCISGLALSCSKPDAVTVTPPTNIDFTIDISSGALATNGGFLVSNGVVVARTTSGEFIAVSASCTHQGTSVNYVASIANFVCPNHGAKFNNSGTVVLGPASTNLTKYNTLLIGTMLRVYS